MLSLAAGCLLLVLSAQARAVAIDTLSVNQFTLQIDAAFNGPGVDASFTQTITPPADITMGVYQGLPGGIISLVSGADSATVYTTGAFGAPVPTGTVDQTIGQIDVDLSSLRASITLGSIPSIGTVDFSLWPLTTPPSMGTYNSATGAYTLSWNVNVVKQILNQNVTVGTATVILGGTATVVPVPAAVWLFGSGLIGLVGVARRRAT